MIRKSLVNSFADFGDEKSFAEGWVTQSTTTFSPHRKGFLVGKHRRTTTTLRFVNSE